MKRIILQTIGTLLFLGFVWACVWFGLPPIFLQTYIDRYPDRVAQILFSDGLNHAQVECKVVVPVELLNPEDILAEEAK